MLPCSHTLMYATGSLDLSRLRSKQAVIHQCTLEPNKSFEHVQTFKRMPANGIYAHHTLGIRLLG